MRQHISAPGQADAAPDDTLAGVAASLAERPYARRGVSIATDLIRVVLVDDHTLLREGLKALLRSVPDIRVVGEAADGVEALAVIARTTPHVVVMDLDMPGGDGATAARALAAWDTPPKVLILTMHSEEEQLLSLLELGASGFLCKDAADRELVDAIRVVASGDTYVRPRVARLLAAGVRAAAHPDPIHEDRARFDALSPREQRVLVLIAEGYNGPETGRALGVTAKTVDTYKQRIAEKLGLTHRTDYVRFALRVGLMAPPLAEPPTTRRPATRRDTSAVA